MTHDFDAARAERYTADREFTFGGETFTRRPTPRAELMAAWEDITNETRALDALARSKALIIGWLEPDNDAVARFEALLDSDVDPIGANDLRDLIVWLYASSAGRPTTASTPSERGREGTGTNLTDISSSEPVEDSPA